MRCQMKDLCPDMKSDGSPSPWYLEHSPWYRELNPWFRFCTRRPQ